MNGPLWRGSGSTRVSHRYWAGASLVFRLVSSVSIFTGKSARHGPQDDFGIHQDGPVVDIIEVMPYALFDLLDSSCLATLAGDLGPAGSAGLHSVTLVVILHRLLVQPSAGLGSE